MKIKATILALAFSIPLFSCGGQLKSGGNVKLTSLKDSVAYSIGVSIGTNLKRDGLDSINLDVLKAAMAAVLNGDSLQLAQQECQGVIQTYLSQKQKSQGDKNLADGKKFLEENKKKQGVKTTASGLQYLVLKDSSGTVPKPTDTVKVHYHGTLIDGTVFDSSVERGEPVEFPVGQVIKGWTEALQLMHVGAKYRLFIPPDLAYGDRQAGQKIGPNSTLIFDVDLLEVNGKK